MVIFFYHVFFFPRELVFILLIILIYLTVWSCRGVLLAGGVGCRGWPCGVCSGML